MPEIVVMAETDPDGSPGLTNLFLCMNWEQPRYATIRYHSGHYSLLYCQPPPVQRDRADTNKISSLDVVSLRHSHSSTLSSDQFNFTLDRNNTAAIKINVANPLVANNITTYCENIRQS